MADRVSLIVVYIHTHTYYVYYSKGGPAVSERNGICFACTMYYTMVVA